MNVFSLLLKLKSVSMEAIKKENNVTVLNHNQYFKSVNCAGLPLLLHI